MQRDHIMDTRVELLEKRRTIAGLARDCNGFTPIARRGRVELTPEQQMADSALKANQRELREARERIRCLLAAPRARTLQRAAAAAMVAVDVGHRRVEVEPITLRAKAETPRAKWTRVDHAQLMELRQVARRRGWVSEQESSYWQVSAIDWSRAQQRGSKAARRRAKVLPRRARAHLLAG